MDRDKFSSNSTGDVVRITFPREDWAFIPNPMPSKWEFDPELWPMLDEAGNQLSTLNGVGQILTEPDLLLRPLQSREAITSSSMEGTFVTPEQLLLYEMDPKEPRSADDKRADWLEVFNYNRALNEGCAALEAGPVNNHLVRNMHSVLMQGVRGRSKAPGQFREKQVQIGSNARYVPPPPSEVPHLMDDLSRYVNTQDGTNPLIKSFIAHYQFEAIHPFEDGNGRVGRSLLSLMIYKWYGHAKPWLYLSPYFEKYKDEYTQNMFRISTDGDWSTWIEFCLRGIIQQSHDAIQRCHLFRAYQKKYHDMVDSPSPRTHAIIEGLFSEPFVTIVGLQAKQNTTYHTARADIMRLVEAGILREVPGTRPKAFVAFRVFSVAYKEDISEEDMADVA